jgi:hypothetical protein
MLSPRLNLKPTLKNQKDRRSTAADVTERGKPFPTLDRSSFIPKPTKRTITVFTLEESNKDGKQPVALIAILNAET